MKKFISIIMAVVLVATGCLPVFAQSAEDYDIEIKMPQVIYYDQESQSYSSNLIKISVVFHKIERFEKCELFVDFNTDLLELEYGACGEVAVYSEYCGATETGIEFAASTTKYSVEGTSYSAGPQAFVKVKGSGKHNLNIRVDVRDKDGNPMDVKVKFTAPCDEIVDVSSYHIRMDEKYLYNEKPKHAFFDIGTTVSEVVALVDAENVAVKNAAGEIMAPDALIATGSRIVTLFNGYEVEAKNVCIKYDVDCNGEITASDARLALRYSAVLENLDDLQYFAAEVTGDKQVTASDARKILRFASGLE